MLLQVHVCSWNGCNYSCDGIHFVNCFIRMRVMHNDGRTDGDRLGRLLCAPSQLQTLCYLSGHAHVRFALITLSLFTPCSVGNTSAASSPSVRPSASSAPLHPTDRPINGRRCLITCEARGDRADQPRRSNEDRTKSWDLSPAHHPF